jgi:hypothetical protein
MLMVQDWSQRTMLDVVPEDERVGIVIFVIVQVVAGCIQERIGRMKCISVTQQCQALYHVYHFSRPKDQTCRVLSH